MQPLARSVRANCGSVGATSAPYGNSIGRTDDVTYRLMRNGATRSSVGADERLCEWRYQKRNSTGWWACVILTGAEGPLGCILANSNLQPRLLGKRGMP